jgi:hypothetical protein
VSECSEPAYACPGEREEGGIISCLFLFAFPFSNFKILIDDPRRTTSKRSKKQGARGVKTEDERKKEK